ncbi:hypothetical protein [Listeria aquatica]|uniref:hypothetical protein n=1 Tax=Listeria aquatica TaxID=1494960 RepID=UPI0031F5AAE9
MKEIKLFFDYNCYPIWVYDDAGLLKENDLPNEIKNDKELDQKLLNLQDRYDSLFTDNEVEFQYNGFEDEESKKSFFTN